MNQPGASPRAGARCRHDRNPTPHPRALADLALSGAHWAPVGAGRPWSAQGRSACWRFETRDGSEHADYDAPDSGIQRAELCSLTRLPYGAPSTAEFDVMVEPGPVSDREWLLVARVHQDDVPGNIGSPPIMLGVIGAGRREYLQVRGEFSAHVPSTDWTTMPARELGRVPFTRGVMHHIVMRYVDGHGTAVGLIRVEVEGANVGREERALRRGASPRRPSPDGGRGPPRPR